MSDWKSYRQRVGLTRRKLAAKLGVSQDTVRQWEQNPKKEPALAYQRKMDGIGQLDGGEE